MTNSTMTKTEARKRARRVMSGGHFMATDHVWQKCSDCGERLESPHVMGRPTLKSLESLIADHFLYDHEVT